MKNILLIAATLCFAAGSAFAGCGKTVTNKGELKSFDSGSKKIVVVDGGKEVKLTLSPGAKGADKLEGLVGKDVVVESEHKKVTSVKAG
jgi:hypothetical protein